MSIKWEYEAVPGFFAQDDPNANPDSIGAVPKHFGLLDTSTDRWATFKSEVDQLNLDANDKAVYKVFFLGRHGQGFHNAAESKYGSMAWNGHLSKLDGKGEVTWGPDAELTDLGERQAMDAREAWSAEIDAGIPIPGKFYCSPLTRAIRTNKMTFEGLVTTPTMILENVRERYGKHTCDKRRPLSYIRSTFPMFEIEDGFSEEDSLWTTEIEPFESVIRRAGIVLDRIFNSDKESYISITAHGGIIHGVLKCIGREWYDLPTGGILPVVIKGTATRL